MFGKIRRMPRALTRMAAPLPKLSYGLGRSTTWDLDVAEFKA